MLETLNAIIGEIGGACVGVRFSPFGRLFDMEPYADEAQPWVALATAFEARPLAYVHLSDQLTIGAEKMPEDFAANLGNARKVLQGIARTAKSTLCGRSATDFDRLGAERPLISHVQHGMR